MEVGHYPCDSLSVCSMELCGYLILQDTHHVRFRERKYARLFSCGGFPRYVRPGIYATLFGSDPSLGLHCVIHEVSILVSSSRSVGIKIETVK